jgi:hypothetical protein
VDWVKKRWASAKKKHRWIGPVHSRYYEPGHESEAKLVLIRLIDEQYNVYAVL